MLKLIALFRRLSNLCRKEFLAILKDPASRVILVMPVLMQSILFGYAGTFDLNNIPYAVLNQSNGATAAELVARLDGTGLFHRVATLRVPGQISEVIDSGKALVVIQIGPDFENRLAQGQDAPIQVILDGRNSTTAGIAGSYVSTIVADFNTLLQGRNPITIESRAWYNPNLETRWNLLPGMMATLSMLQTLMLAALSVAREREQGTFDQLLVTPYAPMEIMLGKAIPVIIISLIQASLVFLIARYWFNIPLAGSLLVLYTGLLIFTIACVGLGLSISAVSGNMQQAMFYAFTLIIPLVMLSGLVTPVQNMPDVLQIATYANPLRFGIDIVRRVYLENADLLILWQDFIPLVVVSLVTLPLAAWLFRHRLV